jgi:transposase
LKPFTERLQGVLPRRRTTQRYRRSLLWACETFADLKRVKKQYRCSNDFLYRALHEQLALKIKRNLYPWPRTIGIDEHSFQRRRTGNIPFVSILVDYPNKKIFELVDSKVSDRLTEKLAHIPGRENVQNAILDLADPYKKFIRNFFPNARMIADKFHVLRLLHPAINRRRKEMSRAGSEQKFKGGLADSSEIVVKYHTATHLLHEALKRVLGPDANQRGSNITAERLRFDFTHPTKMTVEEIKKTEDLVNEWIEAKLPVTREELPKEEALKRGAMHLFGEKYGDTVSIYTVGNLDDGKSKVKGENENIKSVEFCGGPHVNNTSEIGEGNKKFKITKEEAVSAGVRRIKAQLV